MKISAPNSFHRARRLLVVGAFSLIEIIVVVALLSVIILGLLAMFSQTQKVFRTGLTQKDVLEAGRMASEMISREFEQTVPSSRTLFNALNQPMLNFYAEIPAYTPFLQPLPGANHSRTNLIEDVFFLTRRNQEWVGIGYFVRTNHPTTGALGVSALGGGTLYRFESSARIPLLPGVFPRDPGTLFQEFNVARGNEFNTNVSRLLSGVIHFKVRAFDTNAAPVVGNPYATNRIWGILSGPALKDGDAPGEVRLYQFYSNAVPASVEFELGVLENRVWERYQALPPAAQYNYLTNQAGKVHLFRQRVAIHNVDPKAYQ